jgi:hypothetical protein
MGFLSIQNIPSSSQSDTVWINWYKDLRGALGSKKANDIFSRAWSGLAMDDSAANTAHLRETMGKYGIDISGGVLGESLDFARKVGGQVEDLFTVSKWLSIGLATVVVVSIGGLIWQVAFKSSVRKEAVNIGATVATRGLNKV